MMTGYKVFNPDWTCRDFQYEVGKTYSINVRPICCEVGFHFCKDLIDCFDYYGFNLNNKVAMVEAIGDIDENDEDSKCCTNQIKIVRELSWQEVLDKVNIGKGCTGNRNSGNRNSGNWNSGNWNSGDWNSGNRNSGDWNSGDWNSGDWNSGDWNNTSFSSGCFNTEKAKILMFNKPSDWTFENWLDSKARRLLSNIPNKYLEWIHSESMTDEEKEQHPEHKTTGGYLRIYTPEQSAQMWYDSLCKLDQRVIKKLPNFDADIFEQITGIKVNE